MRRGFTEPVTLALIALLSTIITVIFEKESDNAITKIVYNDENLSSICEEHKHYPKIITEY